MEVSWREKIEVLIILLFDLRWKKGDFFGDNGDGWGIRRVEQN